jgi:hypothetical protein
MAVDNGKNGGRGHRGEGSKGGEAEYEIERWIDPSSLSEDELLELQEFMLGDHLGSVADPHFKERLRRDLWCLLVTRLRGGSSSPRS